MVTYSTSMFGRREQLAMQSQGLVTMDGLISLGGQLEVAQPPSSSSRRHYEGRWHWAAYVEAALGQCEDFDQVKSKP